MDKFLIKRKTPNTDDTCDNNGAENLIEESTTPTGSQMEKRRKVTTTSFRKYDKTISNLDLLLLEMKTVQYLNVLFVVKN